MEMEKAKNSQGNLEEEEYWRIYAASYQDL